MNRLRMLVIGMAALGAGACTFGDDPIVTFVAQDAELRVTTDDATSSSMWAEAVVSDLDGTLQINLSARQSDLSASTRLELVGDYERLCPGSYLQLGPATEIAPAALALQNADYDPGVPADDMPQDLHANVETEVSVPDWHRIDGDALELALTGSDQGPGWLHVEFTARDDSGEQVDGSFELARMEQDRGRVSDTWD